MQDATASLKETAAGVADTAKATVNEKVEAVTDKASGKSKDTVVDLGTGANTGATMAGAAPSGSAPDVPRP